ncbi:MAG: stage II sporulation protein P [bacterium]
MLKKIKKFTKYSLLLLFIVFIAMFLWRLKDWTACCLSKITDRIIAYHTDLPKQVLARGLPLFAANSNLVKAEAKEEEALSVKADLPRVKELDGKNPLIAIYHTHTSESYIPWYGLSHTHGGKRGNIADVGSLLKKNLEALNVPVVHSLNIHDYPTFRDSYRRSCVTATELVRKYPSLRLIIDLHRDGGVKNKPVTKINGRLTAQVLLDVGTDRMGLRHPDWRQNLALNKAIKQAMDERYPGLCRGIVVADARYNQHVSPYAVLLEIGDEKCSQEEVANAAYFCAQVLADIVKK